MKARPRAHDPDRLLVRNVLPGATERPGENRRLIIVATLPAAASLLGAALTSHPAIFLLLSRLIGISAVAVQVLIPLSAHLAPDESRRRLLGGIMSGLLLGILLAARSQAWSRTISAGGRCSAARRP